MNHARSNRPIVAASVVQFAVSFSVNFSIPFLTLFIYEELGIGSLSEATLWAGIAQLLASSSLALMSPFWGWLCDRIEGEKMLVRVLIALTAMTGLLSVSTSVYQVLVLRLISGMTSGTSTVVMTIISSSVDEDRLPQAIGYQQSVQTVGLLLGPAVGGIMATVVGFRSCFLISSIMISMAIPFVLWAHFEDRGRPSGPRERIHWRAFKAIGRGFVGLFSVQAAYNFITPMLPLYLAEAGVEESSLVEYNGIILTTSSLAYAASVPITTKIFKRRLIPVLLATASGVVFVQGFLREVFAFTALRMVQCFLHSAVPSFLLGEGAKKDSSKGLTLGILNSATYLGNAVGPFLSSSVAYTTNLTMAFTVSASFSLFAAFAAIPTKRHASGPDSKGSTS